MKNLLTGAAQPVSDINERVRKLFENRPIAAPPPSQRQNKSRKIFAKADAEEAEEDDAEDEVAPEVEQSEEEVPELDTPEANDVAPAQDEPDDG